MSKNNQKSSWGVANPPNIPNALRLILIKLLLPFYLNVHYLYTPNVYTPINNNRYKICEST